MNDHAYLKIEDILILKFINKQKFVELFVNNIYNEFINELKN